MFWRYIDGLAVRCRWFWQSASKARSASSMSERLRQIRGGGYAAPLTLFQHRCCFVNAMLNDSKVKVARIAMLVDQVQSPLLRCGTLSITVGKKARIGLLTSFLQRLTQRIMVLVEVQREEMGRWKIPSALRTTAAVLLLVMNFEGFQ